MSGYWTVILTTAAISALVATGLYFSNSAGALSAAHAALAGLGAYVSAIVTTKLGWPFAVALGTGMLFGYVTGAILARLTLRMNELVAGLTTLAFGETLVVVAYNVDYIGGSNSFTGIPLLTTESQVWIALLVAVFAAWRFDRSRLGLAAQASRHTPVAAQAMGIDVPHVRTVVFAFGSALAALGGALRAHYVLVQSPSDMGFAVSINYLIFWAFGGSYSFVGPAVGAIALTVIPEALRFTQYDRYALYGVVLIIVVILRPEGVIPRIPLGRTWWRSQ